ncbi:Ubiquitin-fold modifier-conjugating enzyme [Trema orientale]|uniref:Ubiquitin-fold modifier-conjugating enzyme n=1 Tax=Trema orientale TaxID=63057 RepID=A0A2P5FQL0_TREOI|nr:Ubiquitin-fold modifier-conjugating enzyme [Trema orientale]
MDLLSDSDWESSSDSGVEDQVEIDFLYGGQAQSIFSSLEQSIEKIDDFLSFERGFKHGDMVLSVTDPLGQMGRVVGIDMVVDLENVQGKIVKNVNSKNLLKIRSYSVGDSVVCGPWLGRVVRVVDRVTVVFDDGTTYQVNTMDQDKLLPISPNILEDAQYPYYPGQRVKVKLSTGSKSARWLCGTWRENQDEGTVCGVEAGLVYVDWLASVLTASNPDLPSPPRVLDSKKLTLLSCFLHANWQLGDWCMLQTSGHKCVVEQTFPASSMQQLVSTHKMFERGTRRNSGSNFEEIFVIVKTKTKIDVVWQDGSISLGLDSPMLLPASVVNSYEFWPEQFVLQKGTYDDPQVFNSQRWGVVLRMDAKERTVKVQWKTITTELNDLNGEEMVETVSAYELVEHPDYCYCFGDLVFRLVQNQFDDQADKDHLNTEIAESEEGKNNGNDKNKYSDTLYLSCIGTATGFADGAVEVRWATGITSKVAPFEIVRVDKQEGTAAVSVAEDVEDLNEEVIEHDKQISRDKQKDPLNFSGVGDGGKKHLWETPSFSLPQAAIGFFTSIAASLLGTSGSNSDSDSTPLVHIPEVQSESGISNAIEVLEGCDLCSEPQLSAELAIMGNRSVNDKANQIQQDNDLSLLTSNDNPDKFRQFDMLADCSDHHFLDTNMGFTLSQVKRSWLKKVQQEWSILEKNLPDTIYVRIFEERMDLIRAAIVGAPGTPYHDGLFFFDIYLPPEYPHEPPHFEALVEEHFSQRSHRILMACKAYMEGAPVGCAVGSGKTEDDPQKGSSTGFKIMLSKLLPKLVEGFSEKGIDCSQITLPEK